MATSSRHLTAVPAAGLWRVPEEKRAATTIRLYDIARWGIANGLEPREVLARLGAELGSELWVCANDSRRSVLPPHDTLPEALAQQLVAALEAGGGALRGLSRLALPDRDALAVPMDVRRMTSLVAIPGGDAAPSFALLQHTATLAGLELERLWARSSDARRRGGHALEQLLDGVAAKLEGFEVADGALVMVALAEGAWDGIEWMHDALIERRIPNLVATRGRVVYGLMPGTQRVLEQLPHVFAGAVVGVSREFVDIQSVATAASQARAALEHGDAGSGSLTWFHDLSPSFLPRSTAEARATVERVLGTIIAYDDEHGTELVRSLATFLQCDRSWQRTADLLCVHKQTLVYRMRRIDELTGRRLRNTEVLAESWFALKAHGLLDG